MNLAHVPESIRGSLGPKRFRTIVLFISVLLASGHFAHGQAAPGDGLVAFYPFDGSATDATGHGNNGIPHNVSFVDDRFGIATNAAAFSGAASHVSLPTTNLNLNLPFSVSVWVKFTNQVSGRVLSTAGYELNINSGSASINLTGVVPTAVPSLSSGKLLPGDWHHIVGVWGDGSMGSFRLYTNGVLAKKASTQILPSYSRGFVPAIGRNSGSGFDQFQGRIDELRVYNRALVDSEVVELFTYQPEPSVGIVRAVAPTFTGLVTGSRYQLQVSTDLKAWTDFGLPFFATGNAMHYPGYWEVDNWNALHFRLHASQ